MDENFTRAVEEGLKLATRICNTSDRYAPPRAAASMERSLAPAFLQPTAPMVYAVIRDPGIVDNPDVPSYQPHVYGRMDPPALIPLQMYEIGAEVECHLDAAVVTVRGSWRVHCVTASKACDCRLVVPLGEQGSVLGIEVDVARKSYSTRVIQIEENHNMEKLSKSKVGGLLKPQMFSLTVPQIHGGSILSFKVSWVQKLLYCDGQFSIGIPFTFPEYVNPSENVITKREKIKLDIDTGTGKEVLCQTTSHALKEIRRQLGSLAFLYEAEVISWSSIDFYFSYTIYSSDIFGGVLLQSPSMHDFDQREMFCLYLFPGTDQQRKVLRKEVVFVIDISGSMCGKPLESATNAISAGLSELTPGDSFSIIAFNEEIHTFSSSLELATKETVDNASQWMRKNCVAGGGTNIMHPLNEAMNMLSKTQDSVPHIFLITDGAVEGERSICSTMRTHVTNRGSIAPRISTFGIGSYCNHYFLRMLATLGRGQYDAAFDAESIDVRMPILFKRALSPIVVDITIEDFDHLDAFEVYPLYIPDLSLGCPLIVSGRYQGNFPDSLKAKGILADMANFVVDLKLQKMKDFLVDRVFAKQQIDLLTAQAWFTESKQLEEKISKLSIQSGFASEYTCMVFLQNETEKNAPINKGEKVDTRKDAGTKGNKPPLILGMTPGFGNVSATLENLPTGFGEGKLQDSSMVYQEAAAKCCNRLSNCCCCMCCIRACSQLNDQFVLVLTQLCTALSVFACMECCAELCCNQSN